MHYYIVACISFGFIYGFFSWLFRIYKSYVWIKKERVAFNQEKNSAPMLKMHILIPVFLEADIIEKTISYFDTIFLKEKENCHLVIITTEKEFILKKNEITTIDVVKEVLAKKEHITHIHYPHMEGKMAHQLNYAINLLTKDETLKVDDFVVVYNADSRPEVETIDWINFKSREKEISVFQQYGCYSGNIHDLQNSKSAPILLASSLWQTRWSIGFEIFNSLKQFDYQNRKEKLWLNYPLNYCIGHGLFIKKNVLEKMGGFSEDSHNEDAILGLQLCHSQELIMPIPYFDISESPDTVKMLYTQKSNWYFGPLQAYSYMLTLLRKAKYDMRGKTRLFLLSTKLFTHAIYWIVGPSLIILSLIISLIYCSPLLLFMSLVSIVLFSLPSIISHKIILKLKLVPSSFALHESFRDNSYGFFFFYVIHGASAYRGISMYLKQLISGKKAPKDKTIIGRV